jgi:hypothetical protein
MYSPQYKCCACGEPRRAYGMCEGHASMSCSWIPKPESFTISFPIECLPEWLGGKNSSTSVTVKAAKEVKPEPMTLERAVEILNARKHLEVEWFAKPMNQFRSIADSRKGHRAEFEAIAIAEKYERESK